ncbi:hypothetical protein AQUCO_04200029v1 [Aquilegia coerulea]|uniref:Uncharacterized protein n=1 Tax=Aquilegia coerulea TaxID=218851 RepID=A0A2G5CNX1_AQUCA|nr:hypothetical protein AQUCO_04200029v1 [Aquilegia coerulea]
MRNYSSPNFRLVSIFLINVLFYQLLRISLLSESGLCKILWNSFAYLNSTQQSQSQSHIVPLINYLQGIP